MQTITPYLLYEDVDAAISFLSKAFGFKEELRYTVEAGYVNHAEIRLGDSKIYLGDPGDRYRNPKKVGETVGIYVLVEESTATASGRRRQAPRSARSRPTRSTASAGTAQSIPRDTGGSSPSRSERSRRRNGAQPSRQIANGGAARGVGALGVRPRGLRSWRLASRSPCSLGSERLRGSTLRRIQRARRSSNERRPVDGNYAGLLAGDSAGHDVVHQLVEVRFGQVNP
jgi:hypothetical protein